MNLWWRESAKSFVVFGNHSCLSPVYPPLSEDPQHDSRLLLTSHLPCALLAPCSRPMVPVRVELRRRGCYPWFNRVVLQLAVGVDKKTASGALSRKSPMTRRQKCNLCVVSPISETNIVLIHKQLSTIQKIVPLHRAQDWSYLKR